MSCNFMPVVRSIRTGRFDIARIIRRSALTLALPCLLATQATTRAHAIPGDLDPSFAGFGNGGQFLTNLPIDAMAVQPDGRTVIAGTQALGDVLHIQRLMTDGTPDFAFGDAGVFRLDAMFDVILSCVAIQPDGKIVVAGSRIVGDDYNQTWVARVTATGVLDSSFGESGQVSFLMVNGESDLSAILVQPDGKIVVAGAADVGGDDDFAAARLFPNGALDPAFGGDGAVTIPFGGDDRCFDMAQQSDGSLVLVGATFNLFDADFAIARLLATGALDTTFDSDGKATTGFSGYAPAKSVAIQSDGKIVVAGGMLVGDGYVGRYWPNGVLDSSLDGDGKLMIQENTCEDIAIRPDGKILLHGAHQSPDGGWKLTIHRRHPDGSVDLTFQGDGDLYIELGDNTYAEDIALYPDGRILVSGDSDQHSAVIRLWPDGSFDVGGQQMLAFDDATFPPGSNEDVYGMAVQPDGRIVLVGTVTTALGTESDVALARFFPNGELDTTFGDHGRVALNVNNFEVGRAVAIQSDGKIVVAGYTGTSNIQFLIARFHGDGELDGSFGFGGFNVLDFAGGPDYANAIGIASDGKIVLAGSVFSGSSMVFGAARFNTNGTVDTSFDFDGKQTAVFPGATTHWASAAMVQPDRKILVGGHANQNFALVRFNENGTLDGGFGSGGYTITDMGGFDAIHALALDVYGRIYAAGGGGPNVDFALTQYFGNGVLHTCGPIPMNCGWRTGKLFVDWGGAESAWAIDIRSDGRVVAAGCVGGSLGWAQVTTGSAFNALRGTTDFVGDIQCESGGEFPISGGAGVQYLFMEKLMVAATQNYEGNRNMALASFETIGSIASDAGDDETASPRGGMLELAFPNPARQSCAVTFNLPRAQSARLRVFDVAGRVVRTLADQSFAAGRHQRVWDRDDLSGRPVAAGVYYLRLDSGGDHEQRSVVVIR